MRVDESWYARVCMSFLNYHVLITQGLELRSKSLHDSFLNSHVLVKQRCELIKIESKICSRLSFRNHGEIINTIR